MLDDRTAIIQMANVVTTICSCTLLSNFIRLPGCDPIDRILVEACPGGVELGRTELVRRAGQQLHIALKL